MLRVRVCLATRIGAIGRRCEGPKAAFSRLIHTLWFRALLYFPKPARPLLHITSETGGPLRPMVPCSGLPPPCRPIPCPKQRCWIMPAACWARNIPRSSGWCLRAGTERARGGAQAGVRRWGCADGVTGRSTGRNLALVQPGKNPADGRPVRSGNCGSPIICWSSQGSFWRQWCRGCGGLSCSGPW